MMQKWMTAAKNNVEKHLGDCCTSEDSEADILENTYLLAFDGAWDAGADDVTARAIARAIVGS